MNSGEERLGQLVKVFRAQFRSHAVEVQDEELGDLGLQEVKVILVGEVGFVRGLREFQEDREEFLADLFVEVERLTAGAFEVDLVAEGVLLVVLQHGRASLRNTQIIIAHHRPHQLIPHTHRLQRCSHHLKQHLQLNMHQHILMLSTINRLVPLPSQNSLFLKLIQHTQKTIR